jgi:hypothetical protein
MKRLILLCSLFSILQSSRAQKNYLIEFGWDYPDVSELAAQLPFWQQTPFDGICFSLQRTIMEAFDTTLHNDRYFELDRMRQLPWGRYTYNFVILRGFGVRGGCWFSDERWRVFTANMDRLSQSMNNRNVRGVLLDPEYYYEDQLYNPWTYSRQQYPNHTFEQVKQQVRQRGTQFMRSLQRYKPDVQVLSIWFASLIAQEKKYTPLDKTRHALLVPFLEGMLLGKGPLAKVIEGNEYAYWNTYPSEFYESKVLLRKAMSELFETEQGKKLINTVEISQPTFYDGLLAKAPSFERGVNHPGRWKWMEEATKHAIASSDNITWVYTERVNWWKKNVNDTFFAINAGNKAALASFGNPSRTDYQFPGSRLLTNNVNSGLGYLYSNNQKTPLQTGGVAFTYNWNKATRQLSVQFNDSLPATLKIYGNNEILATITPPTAAVTRITLDKFTSGQLVILAQYAYKTEAVAIHRYR